MGGGLESRCVGRVYGADGAVRRSGSQNHHPSKNAEQKTICCSFVKILANELDEKYSV